MSNNTTRKSKRLTKAIKEKLVSHILSKAFSKTETALEQSFTDFCVEVYNTCFSKKEIKNMLEFPNSKRAFKYGSFRVFLNGKYCYCVLPKEMPRWANMPAEREHFPAEHPLTIKFEKINLKQNKLKKDKYRLEREINSILSPITTTKKLLNAWPECEQFLQEIGVFKEQAPVPMKSVKNLNFTLCNLLGSKSPTCV